MSAGWVMLCPIAMFRPKESVVSTIDQAPLFSHAEAAVATGTAPETAVPLPVFSSGDRAVAREDGRSR